MSSLIKLIGGDAADKITVQQLRNFLSGGNSQRYVAGLDANMGAFTGAAKRSRIGSNKTFDEMTGAEQQEFLESSKSKVAQQVRQRQAAQPQQSMSVQAAQAIPSKITAAEGTTYFDRAATRLNKELKIEMGDTSPDVGTLKKFLEGSDDALGGVDNAVKNRLTAVRTQLTGERGIGSGTMYSEDAIGAMFRNSEAGNINLGLSAASETASDNLLFKRLGNPDNFISSSLIGAGLGGGTAGLFGGDAGEGAMIGAMVGAGGSIATRAFRDALPELEENVFRKVLANTERAGNVTRSQKLEAISAESFRAPEGLGKMDEFLLNRMKSTEKASIGMQSRVATASGAMLAGAAFSSARTKNKRRGFNQHRGNRF